MSSKNEILNRIKQNTGTRYDMPELSIDAITYEDKIGKFTELSKFVGGNCVELKDENINDIIKKLYPEAKIIASSIQGVDATMNPDEVKSPHELNGVDLAIIKGELGVAENACVWISQNQKEKAIYFIAEHLIILLDTMKIVNNMHEAYKEIEFSGKGFGVFISGPSKTADIEQALVVGAHGARSVTVILK